MDLIKELNKERLEAEVTPVKVGDTVRVHVKVKEGSRERIQVFEGTVIAKKHGGITETITVRRISYGVGVEKVFPVHSPSTRSRWSATVLCGVPSCTICAAAWARAPRSRKSCDPRRKRGESLSFFLSHKISPASCDFDGSLIY